MIEHKNENEEFKYTYSAREQEEVKSIRQKYIQPEEDKMEHLRRLDRSFNKKGTKVSIIIGIIGILLLGVGMFCTIVWQEMWFIPGIIIGLIGIAVIAAAYPIYSSVTKNERAKIAPEIIRLTDDLLK